MTNVVILDGRLTGDPDVHTNQNTGKPTARFTLAVGRNSSDGQTDFIRCLAFDKTADTLSTYVRKGMRILVNGTIRTGSYQDREGKTVYTTDVLVNRFDFLEKKGETQAAPQKPVKDSVPEFLDIPSAEDGFLPFV